MDFLPARAAAGVSSSSSVIAACGRAARVRRPPAARRTQARPHSARATTACAATRASAHAPQATTSGCFTDRSAETLQWQWHSDGAEGENWTTVGAGACGWPTEDDAVDQLERLSSHSPASHHELTSATPTVEPQTPMEARRGAHYDLKQERTSHTDTSCECASKLGWMRVCWIALKPS